MLKLRNEKIHIGQSSLIFQNKSYQYKSYQYIHNLCTYFNTYTTQTYNFDLSGISLFEFFPNLTKSTLKT